ncbi:gp53-like domain-containing protein, partial [Mixta calida]|uniref:gp53-like domain-containing protein n=1 Tax=Mixta calida TaxID=665913 RepID=UPI003F6886BE
MECASLALFRARVFFRFLVGLGEAAKLDAPTGFLATSGWIKIPISSGVNFIIQWGRVSVSAPLNIGSTLKGYDGATSFTYPIAFPNAALMVSATPSDSGETLIETATAGINSKNTASIRIGGVAVKSDPLATIEMQAFVFALGY